MSLSFLVLYLDIRVLALQHYVLRVRHREITIVQVGFTYIILFLICICGHLDPNIGPSIVTISFKDLSSFTKY